MPNSLCWSWRLALGVGRWATFKGSLLILVLAACAPTQTTEPRYDLVVQNRCQGANQTVYLYINNQYWGLIRGSRAVENLRPGFYNLRAVGTGNNPDTFTRGLNLSRDAVWTLCL